ncbi:hypothetical protein SAMN05421811_10316 [Nonomuraea wenchangensis]|uniref:Uncharacterized protein n=2 Tax=Nonomuraea wenchangensis TaxID=568860 RepID=A0A1I0EEZ4_9ACTN|nr:hypothetical protein SAMN05421811_10316 [Nonomuraea wenchangensis]
MAVSGTPELAAYAGFIASDPIPLMRDSEWTGVVPYYEPTGAASTRFLIYIPDSGISGDQALVTTYTTGTATQWVIRYGNSPTGSLKVQAYDADGSVLLDSGFITFNVIGKKTRISLDLSQVGSDIEWDVSTLEPGASVGLTFGGTLSSQTLGRVLKVVASAGGGILDSAMGHISVQSAVESIHDLGPQLGAYDGESAGRRIERLCAEENISFTSAGDLDDSTKLGPQTPDTFINLITEAAETDLGLLYEPRNDLGLAYRTRTSLYNQAAMVALDYEEGHLAPPLEPVDDDQSTRNDVTTTRKSGSSARYVMESGPLSVADPPAGVGRYDEQVTVNVQSDGELLNQANWRVHLGTVDEARYPQITVDLSSPGVASDAGLTADVVFMDLGDRLTIDNQPAWLPPNQISQLVYGCSERMATYDWEITVNCVPESPWQVAVYGTSRYGTEYSTLNSSVTSSATSISVATSKGPLWTTSAGDLPLDIEIGGERMRVTAISGSSSPQTFTVTRHINGITKSHSSGSVVKLANPAVRAL